LHGMESARWELEGRREERRSRAFGRGDGKKSATVYGKLLRLENPSKKQTKGV